MTTVTHFQNTLQQLLNQIAEQAGYSSKFIRRQRKLSGASFVQTLVWGWLSKPEASLEELSQTAALCGVEISAQGLAQRMTETAAECLRTVLEASLMLVAQGTTGSHSFLERFNGVYLLDSTSIALPQEWASQWSGCGNQHGSSAGMKVQTLWDYQGGSLHLSLHPSRWSDVNLPVVTLPAGALRLSDCGYFDATRLQTLAQADSYYLLRVPSKVQVQDGTGRLQRLSAFLRRHAQPDFDGWVSLTGKGLPCRLLAQRAPQAVVHQRQQRIRQRAFRKGQSVSQEALALAAWTILVTNLPAAMLSFDEAFVLLRLRWQIELLFKLWKQHANLSHSRSLNPQRILCEIYAKLIGLLIQHALLLLTAWDVPRRSLVKMAQTIRKFIFALVYSLRTSAAAFAALIETLTFVLRSGCRSNKRKTQPALFQRLLCLS
jgi:hypothetical protein